MSRKHFALTLLRDSPDNALESFCNIYGQDSHILISDSNRMRCAQDGSRIETVRGLSTQRQLAVELSQPYMVASPEAAMHMRKYLP